MVLAVIFIYIVHVVMYLSKSLSLHACMHMNKDKEWFEKNGLNFWKNLHLAKISKTTDHAF